MIDITRAVGNKSANLFVDVQKVQRLINTNLPRLMPFLALKVDGDCGPVSIGMILEFQYRVMGLKKPDGRVDPGKKTIVALNEYSPESNKTSSTIKYDNLLLQVQQYLKTIFTSGAVVKKPTLLTDANYAKAANVLGVDVALIKAVASVESRGNGFLSNGKPKILFEGHWFSKLTKGSFDKVNPTISYKTWTKKFYKKEGEAEYGRYMSAKGLDSAAAMKSASWGKFQIMGFNHKAAGYNSVQEFVTAMHESESKQLLAFVNFLKYEKLDIPLKIKSWATFAEGYNGPDYAKNKYEVRLKQAYKAFSAGSI